MKGEISVGGKKETKQRGGRMKGEMSTGGKNETKADRGGRMKGVMSGGGEKGDKDRRRWRNEGRNVRWRRIDGKLEETKQGKFSVVTTMLITISW